jgi:hypothetical protein
MIKTCTDFTRIAVVAFWTSLLAASSAPAQVLLIDNFDDTHGPAAAQGDGIVDIAAYRPPFGGDANDAFVGRTQFRFTQPAENVSTAAPGSTDGKVAVLELSTYNPLDPGAAFFGTDMITKRNFARGGGLRMTTRMRVDAAAAAQGGMVAAPFLYDVQRESPPGTLVRDEIDHELITNFSTGATPHSTFTNVWNDGNFDSAGAGQFITNPAGFNISAFHDYRTDWTPTSVKYYIDGTLVRTETSVVPDDPMRAHWNFWAPDNSFTAAFNAGLNPTATSPGTTYKLELDRVQIERFDTVKGPNLLLDSSFEGQLQNPGGIGGWQLFNNAFFETGPVIPQDGATALKVFGPFSGGANASGAWQNVAAAPGQEFEGSVWAFSPLADSILGNPNYTALTLQFCNAANEVIGSVDFSPGTNQKETAIYDGRDPLMIQAEWVQYTVNGLAPADTAYARLNLFFIQLTPNLGGAVWFDNVELNRLTSNAPSANFDGDDDVDGVDFLTWQRNIGGAGTLAQGDANNDGTVNGLDFAVWKEQFGAQQATANAAAIPEPSTWAVASVLAAGRALRRRRK